MPEPLDEPVEPPQAAEVRRTPVVLVVAPEFGIERRGLILDRVVPMLLAPLRHRLHTGPVSGPLVGVAMLPDRFQHHLRGGRRRSQANDQRWHSLDLAH